MRRIRLWIGLLSLSLTVLATSALVSSAAAQGLYCFHLQGCAGSAGCLNYGQVVGPCTIQCLGGGTVYCESSGGDGGGGGGGSCPDCGPFIPK